MTVLLRYHKRNLRIFLLTGMFLINVFARAQSGPLDTLRLSLPAIEKKFLDSNLLLLAAHFNVDAQKALIQQAKLWDNPVLNTDQVMAANGHFFPFGKNADGSYSGQYFVQVQQLIRTAGKRGKLINLATTNAQLSELQLQDVLRNLLYQLHTDYYTLQLQLGNQKINETQLARLNKLLSGMQGQLNAGNLAEKDYLRIQALVIALEQDITELHKSISDTEADLKTLLQMKDRVFIAPIATTNPLLPVENLVNTDVLFEAGKKNNPYYLLQQTQTIFQQQNLALQKSLRIPDITLGPNFDRNSNFAPNYVGLGISLPLPLLNKNQGNIKSAESIVKQQQSITANAETELLNNISNAYNKLLLTMQQNNAVQKLFYEKYGRMYESIVNSYQLKQISLLEFLDFFNDYAASQQRLLQQQLNWQLAKEEINYQTGTAIFK